LKNCSKSISELEIVVEVVDFRLGTESDVAVVVGRELSEEFEAIKLKEGVFL
jgi:hypothetical protein